MITPELHEDFKIWLASRKAPRIEHILWAPRIQEWLGRLAPRKSMPFWRGLPGKVAADRSPSDE
eukprot:11173782-Lingulodinium_polyedra.AAC.1